MDVGDVARAITASTALGSELGLAVDEVMIVCNSNKLALRLLPCEVLARVAFSGQEAFQFEIEVARRLTENGSPVARLDTRVEPCVYERDGFALTLWRYWEQSGVELSASSYAKALERLHAGLAQVDVIAPHFSERVSEAQRLVGSRARTPGLDDSDRELLLRTFQSCGHRLEEQSSREQLLHGEPHPGNVLRTAEGLLFIDLETSCRGPVEFDLAHVPEAVCDAYARADCELIQECRRLVLAMVAAWRWDTDDQFPNGERFGRALLGVLRAGPPWPTLDVVMHQ
jgi:aminoglycoside phosphotransferase (APT) family kinase protein